VPVFGRIRIRRKVIKYISRVATQRKEHYGNRILSKTPSHSRCASRFLALRGNAASDLQKMPVSASFDRGRSGLAEFVLSPKLLYIILPTCLPPLARLHIKCSLYRESTKGTEHAPKRIQHGKVLHFWDSALAVRLRGIGRRRPTRYSGPNNNRISL